MGRQPDKIKETTTKEVAVAIIRPEGAVDTTIKEEATIKEVVETIITKIPETTTIEVAVATVEAAAMAANMTEATDRTLILKAAEAEEVDTTNNPIKTMKEEILSSGETTTTEPKNITPKVVMKMVDISKEEEPEVVEEPISIATNRDPLALHLQVPKEMKEEDIREEDSITLSSNGSIPSLMERNPPKSLKENNKRSEAFWFSYF